MKPVIVIPAYNRPAALHQLLKSVNQAVYPDSQTELILSLEAGASNEVKQIAKDFQFQHGKKKLIYRDRKLGVKKHIFTCADESDQRDGVIILEDDLTVSPYFFVYAVEALKFYAEEDRIGGISLYSQRFNETSQLPFIPMPGNFSVYFMQLASSWGQAWTTKQWRLFRNWLNTYNVNENDFQADDLPQNISKWGSDSWKLLFNIYLLKTGRTIIYPYNSYSTNNSYFDGKHMMNKGDLFQVPIGFFRDKKPSLQFPSFDEQQIRYDMFMEFNPSRIAISDDFKGEDICLDLYGTKPDKLLQKYRFTVTPRLGPGPLRSFSLSLIPPELNLIYDVNHKGRSFFHLYRRDQISALKSLSYKQYAQLAEFYSYFKPMNRRFLKGFSIRLLQEILKKISNVR